MCRFAAYAGPSRPLSTLLFDPPRSLEEQAYRPREMLRGTVNVDGTGVAWWPDDHPDPLRYVSTATPWADPNLAGLSRRLTGRIQLSAVRSATPGIPFGPGNVAPFVQGPVAFAHNGELGGFRTGVGRELVRRLPDGLYTAFETASDSLALFLTLLRHRDAQGGRSLAAATAAALTEVAEVVRGAGHEAALNILVSDGTDVVATRASVGWTANSLYLIRDASAWPGATVVASEALDDDPAWEPIEDDRLVRVGPDGIDIQPLDLP